MKTILLLAAIAPHYLNAQINLGLKTPGSVKPAVEKVLNNYADHYSGIRGDTMEVTPASVIFYSTVKPENSLECTLTQYIIAGKYDYSWEAVMLRTDDYEAASKKYNAYCNQLKNISFTAGSVTLKMDGDYEAPGVTKSFFSTVYRAHSTDDRLSRIRLEISMQSDYTEWTVKLMVYEQVHEDREGNTQ